ncbi:MAG: GNAT family N-acetyltransferase [Leptothrix sp. (in: b-proteobacteria)]
MAGATIELICPDTPAWLDAARQVFRDYADSLGIDLGFQGFEAELAGLPGDYAEPGGLLLLARVNGELAGCGAYRALPDADVANACEMKRLFVRAAFRRLGLGRLLAQSLIDRAREAGYAHMYLDTLSDMEAARDLYADLGFHEVAPYYFNPLPGAHYLCADLGHGQTGHGALRALG